MNNLIKKYIGKGSLMMAFAFMTTGVALTSCSDDTLSNINTDKTKVSNLDPNAQLTTALLQTYGDFSLMDTYRNYITGFTQHFAGGWNVPTMRALTLPKTTSRAVYGIVTTR